MSKLAELLRDAGPQISRITQRFRETPITVAPSLLLELEAVLHLRNGFVCVDGTILVRPSVNVGQVHGIERWNEITLWRTPYSRSADVLFFAETIFGWQFGLRRDEVVALDPETGALETLGFSLERWADLVLAQADRLGRTAKKMWELEHGPLTMTDRLQRRLPLRFGGDDFTLTVLRDLDLMKRYAAMYLANLGTTSADDPKLDGWWAGPEDPVDDVPEAPIGADDDASTDALGDVSELGDLDGYDGTDLEETDLDASALDGPAPEDEPLP
jgi:hypothetical protein